MANENGYHLRTGWYCATITGKEWPRDAVNIRGRGRNSVKESDPVIIAQNPPDRARPRPGYFHPKTWEDGVMPLSSFPQWKQDEIARVVARPTPPKRWLRFELCQMESRAWYEWHWERGLKLPRVPGYEPRARRHIPDSLRLQVYDRDGWRCLHCQSAENLSLDHIHPYSLGGDDTLENLQTLCRSCNSRKGVKV